MESKRRGGKKRARDYDRHENSDLEEKISSSSKRRKSSKHDSGAHKSNKSNNTKSFKNSGAEKHERVVALSEVTYRESVSNTSIEPSTNSHTRCLARHVRKTYASSSSRRQARKERNKLRGSDEPKSLSSAVDEETDEGASAKWTNQISTAGSESSSKSVHTEKERFERSKSGNKKHEDCGGGGSPGATNSAEENKGKESEVQVILHNSYEKKKRNELTAKSTPSSKANQEVVSPCTQQMRLAPGGVASIVFSTIPSQSHIMASPVACPVTPVLCHSNTPLMPLQSLATNTSAISSVTAPVVALPLLPEVTQDISGNLGFPGSTQNSLMHSILKPDMSVGYQSPHDSTSEDIPYSTSGSQNNSHVAVSGGGAQEMHPPSDSEMEILDVKDEKIPLIDIEDDCETLLIEKTEEDYKREIKDSPPKSPDRSCSSGSNSENGDSNIVATVKLENWASYLLQRLESFFDREEECDVVLKFSGGQVLKAHRPIISACTSLLSQPKQPQEPESEIIVPPELDYASVEPILRFVYSGRLDVRGSETKLPAIYIASQRLQVSLLTQLMNRRFPHLRCNRQHTSRHQVGKRTEKLSKHSRQKHGKGRTRSFRVFAPSGSSPGAHLRAKNPQRLGERLGDGVDTSNLKEIIPEEVIKCADNKEEEGLNDSSMYFLVTNSQKIAQANAAVRRKRPAETARPTRFELEEESENSSVQIATWSSKSPLPPYYSSGSNDNNDNSISVSTPVSNSTVSVTSPNSVAKNTNVTWSSSTSPSNHLSGASSNGEVRELSISQSQDQFPAFSQNTVEKSSSNSPSSDYHDSPDLDEECLEEEDTGKESKELMEKISNICKQLEDGDADEMGSNVESPSDTQSSQVMVKEESKSSLGSSEEDTSESNDCIILDSSGPPKKSILKKKKEKSSSGRIKKRVSFPLDENNELINEVATYSNSKEPSQSLIDVQKTVGSFRSSEDSPSPVKLTLSLKKKVLMNLALDDSDVCESSSHGNERGKSKKTGVSSGQSTSQGITQGDMSSHAKIISEVLKKYPHLVKDRKNIRLKILKKGSDKSNGGKLVKSKVQYLVLSENEHKNKSSSKHDKSSVNGSKVEVNSSSRAVRTTQKFNCPECEEATFSSYFAFKKHVTAEHKDKSSSILAGIDNVPYACYTCFLNEPLEFADYCSYQQHMKEVHSKRESRLCSICGYRPGRKLELAYHQYIEHNKIPRNVTFPKCDLCDHVAMNDAALLKHRSQHANADNYTCSVCGVAFRSFGALQGHMQTKLCQSKPSVSHKCPYCPQTFARSYNLKAHCKSNHRAAHLAAQAASNSANESKQGESQTKVANSLKKTDGTSEGVSGGGGLMVEHVCETITGMSNNQSSSEAEALSTVANSLAASLGLPEETVNHYMYAQGSKIDFTADLDNEKYEDNVARPNEVNAQLMESAASVSGYSGNLPLCHDGTYTSQTPISTTTTVGTFYPVGVVPSQLVPGQIVSGEILQSQVLPGTCVNVAGSTVLGAPSHSWTYVTYQVPTSGEDLPSVITDSTNIAGVSADQNSAAGVETPLGVKSSKNENALGNRSSGREGPNSLVVMANTATQVSISHASHISTPQSYDAFSSQFV
ncbi:serine-rich adhesin for platelets-like [Macrobrachium rosenbergii]|uniref:serine-rich adhesin for platelets-like n=1 Tax=Macrobrachium rosenbergii TaxID=79674 RepID=UPI0034D3B357